MAVNPRKILDVPHSKSMSMRIDPGFSLAFLHLEKPDFKDLFLSWNSSARRAFLEALIAEAGRELVPGCFRSYDIRIDEKHLSNAVVF